jgi:tetratricopeptide (TPR) repeat protein
MRNWARRSGVYSIMVRMPLFLICAFAALAQPSFRQDPLDTAVQSVWQARNSGRFEEAAAARDQARALLQRAPVDSPRFAGWAQEVAQSYQNSGWSAQARAILQEALSRTAPLGESHPSRIAIVTALGNAWMQDGNLLKAVGYLEQAAAAQAAAPPPTAAQPVMGGVFVSGTMTARFGNFGGVSGGSAIYAYTHLASVYQQLGRPDAVAAIAVKIRALAANDELAVARFYEEHGQFDEAAAIYKKVAEKSADAQTRANAWQSLAGLYGRQERYTDAVAAMQQAISDTQSADNSGIRGQTPWMRQNLAGYMRQAGLLDQADEVYRQLQQESQGGAQEIQMLCAYAQHLVETKRGAQAESLLKDYLTQHPDLDPQQRMQVLYDLANVARGTGGSKKADEYQQAAEALQAQTLPPPGGQIRIAEEVRNAQTAVNQRRFDDAYGLTLQAIDDAARAADGEQVEWLVTQTAQALAAHKERARAEQLFQRMFSLAQNWSADRVPPLIMTMQNYARFLMGQPDRLGEVPAALEQYRRTLKDANGPDSGSLAEPLRMKLEFERSHSQWERADASARELLELQESLSGNTSERYLGDLQMVARVYQAAGDSARALALFRKAVTIADLVTTPNNDWSRSQTRMEAALALAHLGQFDEAETLGEEAVALHRNQRTPSTPMTQPLEQIRRMKRAAAAAASRVDQKL